MRSVICGAVFGVVVGALFLPLWAGILAVPVCAALMAAAEVGITFLPNAGVTREGTYPYPRPNQIDLPYFSR